MKTAKNTKAPMNLFPEAESSGTNLFPESQESMQPEMQEEQPSPQEPMPQQASQQPADLQSMIGNLLKQQGNYTKGALRGGAQGVGDVLASMGNVGMEAGEAVGNKLMPSLFEQMGIHFPHVRIPHPELTKHHNPASASEAAGETIMENVLPMLIPAIGGAKGAQIGNTALQKALAGIASGAATGYASNEENRPQGAVVGGVAGLIPSALQGIGKYISSRNVGAHEPELEQALKHLLGQESELKGVERVASHEFGARDPESMLLKMADKENSLKEANLLKENKLPEEKMLPGEQTVPEAKHNIENVHKAMAEHLGEGEAHIQKLSNHIVDSIEGKKVPYVDEKTGFTKLRREGGFRKIVGSKFNDLTEQVAGRNIELPGTVDTKALQKSLMDSPVLKSRYLTDKAREKLENEIKAFHTKPGENVSGAAFLNSYRTLSRIEGKTRSQAFKYGTLDPDKYITEADAIKKQMASMENLMEKHFPPDVMTKLRKINHIYATHVAPLNENPIYQQMLKHGKYKGDLIEALSGTTKGNEILNDLIHSHPELSRLVLGKSFAKSPGKLMEPNKLLDPYLKANPEISRLMEHQKTAHSNLEHAQQMESIHKVTNEIPKLQSDLKRMQELHDKLRKEGNLTASAKENYKSKEDALKEAIKKKEETKSKITNRAIGGLTTLGVEEALRRYLMKD
jgi:hypothetical protein